MIYQWILIFSNKCGVWFWNGSNIWTQLYQHTLPRYTPGLVWLALQYAILLRKYELFITQYPKEPQIWPITGILDFLFVAKVFHMCYIQRFLTSWKCLTRARKVVWQELSHFPWSGETLSATQVNVLVSQCTKSCQRIKNVVWHILAKFLFPGLCIKQKQNKKIIIILKK